MILGAFTAELNLVLNLWNVGTRLQGLAIYHVW
jgi:hypothetical protein